MPIGNGRMGTLVWTTPSALKFQINRVDVFAEHASTTSFPKADSDYLCELTTRLFLDINVSQAGDDVFTGAAFHQSLSVYDALMTAKGSGLSARVVASPNSDVIAVEIDDERSQPESVTVDLRMLRYAIQGKTGKNYELTKEHAVAYTTAEHTATSSDSTSRAAGSPSRRYSRKRNSTIRPRSPSASSAVPHGRATSTNPPPRSPPLRVGVSLQFSFQVRRVSTVQKTPPKTHSPFSVRQNPQHSQASKPMRQPGQETVLVTGRHAAPQQRRSS